MNSPITVGRPPTVEQSPDAEGFVAHALRAPAHKDYHRIAKVRTGHANSSHVRTAHCSCVNGLVGLCPDRQTDDVYDAGVEALNQCVYVPPVCKDYVRRDLKDIVMNIVWWWLKAHCRANHKHHAKPFKRSPFSTDNIEWLVKRALYTATHVQLCDDDAREKVSTPTELTLHVVFARIY